MGGSCEKASLWGAVNGRDKAAMGPGGRGGGQKVLRRRSLSASGRVSDELFLIDDGQAAEGSLYLV
jgi:hypothetical protein